MKKYPLVLGIFLLGVFNVSASIWEGAAAVSSGGDLPDTGLYVATNSFPRNTVVDLINLETGKTVRVLVAAGLDSPGLLAMVSKEAAAAIGLQNRSIGRIRMTQPPDPIAFSQFRDSRMRSGDPDFDPQAALSKVYPEGNLPPSGSGGTAAEGDSPPSSAVTVVPGPVVTETEPNESGPALETESEKIVTTLEPEPEPENAEALAYDEPEPESYTAPTVIPDAPAAAEVMESHEDYPQAETAWLVPEPEVEKISSVPETPEYSETPVEASPLEEAETIYTLVPAEERPPGALSESGETYLIDPIPSYTELPEVPPANAAMPWVFDVPTVTQLEPGKYYLQIGAFSKVEAVKREIARIETEYPLAVQFTGSAENPMYRILVGPLNHGESGAMLQNFKTRGYKDAFVRSGS
jgi:hypothetical protein